MLNVMFTPRGMRSRGFQGSRIKPVEERKIPNIHRALCEDVLGDD